MFSSNKISFGPHNLPTRDGMACVETLTDGFLDGGELARDALEDVHGGFSLGGEAEGGGGSSAGGSSHGDRADGASRGLGNSCHATGEHWGLSSNTRKHLFHGHPTDSRTQFRATGARKVFVAEGRGFEERERR